MIMSLKQVSTKSTAWRGLFAALILVGFGAMWIALRQESLEPQLEAPAEPPAGFRSYVGEEGPSKGGKPEQPSPSPSPEMAVEGTMGTKGEILGDAREALEMLHPGIIEAMEARDQEEYPGELGSRGREEQLGEDRVWEDPVNREVLGPPAWMATPSDDEAARIQAVFDEAEQLRAENEDTFVLDDRHRAIELARDAVEDCFDALLEFEPGAIGRVIIAFDIRAAAGTATLEQGRITTIVGLHDLDFIACVETNLEQITFGAVGEGVHSVEYPLFFDQ